MPAPVETFSPTTDLYLQMLREAQRVEDKKLIRLLRDRLKHVGQPPKLTSAGCEIICFPGRGGLPVPSPIQDLPFWPHFGFGEIAAFAAIYLLMIACDTYLV